MEQMSQLQLPNYVFPIVVTRVVDGDTIDMTIDLGFSILHKQRLRMMGIDTPESRTRNKAEKRLGLMAKVRLKELIAAAPIVKRKKQVFLQTSKQGKGKFGRILGALWVNDENLNEVLIREGHAREYYGGSKNALGPWTIIEDGNVYRWTPNGYRKMSN
jgi:micrococcal nuclease